MASGFKSASPAEAALRVSQYSRRMKDVQAAVKQGWAALDLLRGQADNIGLLGRYYAGDWLSDFEADERGAFGPDIDRSVLAEDTLYNLLDEINELRDSLSGFADAIR